MSGFLSGGGLLLAAAAAGAAILLPAGRARSAAMLAAMALFPILILGDQWHAAEIVDLRHHLGRAAALAAAAAVAVAALAYAALRWRPLLPLAIVFALPFRVPLHAGGESANLLVPLYLVIAAGALAAAVRDWNARPAGGAVGRPMSEEASATAGHEGSPAATGPAGRAAVWLPRVLAAVVVVYAAQALYSEDFSKGLQNVCFFFLPFSVAFALLRDVEWTPRLLRWVLVLLAVEAAAFVVVGSVEGLSRDLFWNNQIIRSNEFHTYFRVNSVFWDPNIYGRYLALVTVVATAVLLWTRRRRPFWLLCGLILVLWIGLVPTYSESSLIALLGGLALLAAVRWSWRWTLAAAAVGLVLAVLVVLLAGGSGKLTPNRINVDLSGRGNLVSGGAELFAERPLQGYGSGSFQRAYAAHRTNKHLPVTVSHTEPVTVAAEQGLVGLALYLALIISALWTLGGGLWTADAAGPAVDSAGGVVGGPAPEEASATAGGGGSPAATGPAESTGASASRAARAAVLAAFVALLVHTLAYAGFFEDPITWVLLAVGMSLAAASPAPAARAAAVAVRDPA